MANTDNPGFRPAVMESGGRIATLRFSIAAASATAMFVGDVVSAVSTGTITPAAADAGITVVGVVTELFDSNGVPIGSPGSSISTKYLPASTAGYATVALACPSNIFIVQSSTLAAVDVFSQANHVATAGDTTTGKSGHDLGATASGAQCMILGKVESPDNAWGAHVKVYVKFMEGMNGPITLTVAV